MKPRLITAILLVLLGTGYYFREPLLRLPGLISGKQPEAKSVRPPAGQPVVTDVVVEITAPVQVTAIGNVQSMATVTIQARVDGEINQVHFEEGKEVKQGDLLFTLDDRAFRAQLQQAEANLERDRALLQRAQLEFVRQTELASRGVASTQKLDDVKANVAVLQATIRASEAMVENARVNLNYTQIRAPISGRSGSVAFKRGNVLVVKASGSAPLLTITQLRPIYVTFTVPESHLPALLAALAEGTPSVVATAPNQEQNPIPGELVFIDNQVDVATGTISLKAKFANDDTRLWPGQFVNVNLTVGVQADAVAVPSAAIQIGQNGPYLFVVKQDSTVELRLVRVNRTMDNRTIIAEGVKAGERIVVDGQLRLNNGTRVTVQRPEGTTPAKAQPSPIAERKP